ncbi:MAG TPA: Cof-type HAD-IIB family hydrolase [Vicinamibacteria bacterium]|nr:Cof-type HAD-IIB family hydrolase [Vicinamibacteria bacterium]
MGRRRDGGRGPDRARRHDRRGGDLGRNLAPFRLLALDIDGTLLRTDKRLSPRVRSAVLAARARGVTVVLVTGRRPPAARRVAEELGGGFTLVLHNGALVVEDGELVRALPLPRDAALRAIDLGREAGLDPVVHVGQRGEGKLLAEGLCPSSTLLSYYLDKSHPDVIVVRRLEDALQEDPIQVMFGDRLGVIDAFHGPLARALEGEASVERTVYPAQGIGLIDVLHRDVGKAAAVEFLCRRLGIASEEVMAIGDNWNDRALLEAAGRGIVMGNADPALRALGLEVAPSNDEDGAAWAIETHLLLR